MTNEHERTTDDETMAYTDNWRRLAQRDPRLSAHAKLIACVLSDMADWHTGKSCYPSIATICQRASIRSRTTVHSHLNQLAELGYLDVHNHVGGVNSYDLLVPEGVHQMDGGCSPDEQGGVHQMNRGCPPDEHNHLSYPNEKDHMVDQSVCERAGVHKPTPPAPRTEHTHTAPTPSPETRPRTQPTPTSEPTPSRAGSDGEGRRTRRVPSSELTTLLAAIQLAHEQEGQPWVPKKPHHALAERALKLGWTPEHLTADTRANIANLVSRSQPIVAQWLLKDMGQRYSPPTQAATTQQASSAGATDARLARLIRSRDHLVERGQHEQAARFQALIDEAQSAATGRQ